LLIKLPRTKDQGILKSMYRASNLYELPTYTAYKDTVLL
jgi:hypothetical protein